MIEAIALCYASVASFGVSGTLCYWVVASFLSWLLCGLFTRGRNEDLEALLVSSTEAATVPGCLGDGCAGAAGVDLAAAATPATPGVRRSKSGASLEVFSEVRDAHSSVANPWVNATWRVTAAERLKMAVLAPWVLPARLSILVAAVAGACVFANLATAGWDGTRPESLLARVAERRRLRFAGAARSPEALPLRAAAEDRSRVLPDTERMPRWRRAVGAPVMWCVRAVLAGMGFWRVEVAGAVDPAARVVVCNHLSMIEPLALLIATGGATPVTASDFAALPALGPVGKLYQLLWLDRSDATSRAVVVDAIAHRTTRTSPGAWPPVLVFPEGTTLNGRALIAFKPGAFGPGAAVQPCVARFPFAVRCGLGLDPSWTTAGPQFGELSLRMMLQPWNRLRLEFLPTRVPDAAERADPALFARNTRDDMARALRCPVTDHSWADMWLNMTARDLGEPPHKTLVQLTALRRLLGPAAERHAAADALKRFASADDEKDGSLTLAQFRAALRGDSAEIDDADGGGADDARALFNLLRKDADSVDFFAFLVGVALLEAGGVGSGASGALELVFGLLDADGTGLVPRSRADLALDPEANARVPADEERDAFIAATSSGAGDPLLDCAAFCDYVRANSARFARRGADLA